MNCIFSRIDGNIIHGRWDSQNKQYQFTDGVEVRNEEGDIIPLSDIREGDEVQLSGQPATLITVRRSEQGIQEKARQDADTARTKGRDAVHTVTGDKVLFGGNVGEETAPSGTSKGQVFGPVTTAENPHPAPSPSSTDQPLSAAHTTQSLHAEPLHKMTEAERKAKADAESRAKQKGK